MNPLPMVFAAGAIAAAISGFHRTMLLMWFAALLLAIYHNLQWSKVFKASAVIIAAWAAKRK